MILDTYHITTLRDRYILRVYPYQRRNLNEIRAELDFLIALSAQGVSVSIPIQQTSGEYILPLAAPEGVRYATLFTYAPGQPLNQNAEPAHVYAFGYAIAQIHAIADSLPRMPERKPIDLDMLFNKPLQDLERAFPHHHDDWSDLRQIGAIIRPRLDAFSTQRPAYGMCHGDVGSANVHVTADGKLTLFDFDFCGPGWRAYDIGTFLIDESQAIQEAFLAGYQEVRVLSDDELATIPLFQILQSIWVLGLRANYVNEWGSSYFSERFVNAVLNFIRATFKTLEA